MKLSKTETIISKNFKQLRSQQDLKNTLAYLRALRRATPSCEAGYSHLAEVQASANWVSKELSRLQKQAPLQF
jgi:hypothetical protein